MSKRIKWHIEVRKIIELKPYEKNPRIITDLGLNVLGESFNEIGYAQLININTDGTILSGHARYMQLKREGVLEVEVFVPDRLLTPKQEETVVIRMNKNTAGSWDIEKLNLEFDRDDLLEWGFNEGELNFEKIELSPAPSDDREEDDEENRKWLVEVQFPNEMEMMDIYDDLINRGYIARIKK